MQRHPVLHKLTEDHHHALVQARHLKAAEPAAIAGRVRAFFSAWRSEIAAHFIEEEGALLPAVCPPLLPDEPVVVRVLAQHLAIRRLVSDLADAQAAGDDARCLTLGHELGEMLDTHIRMEEHDLFERIQAALRPAELAALGQRLRAWEGGAAGAGRYREEQAAVAGEEGWRPRAGNRARREADGS